MATSVGGISVDFQAEVERFRDDVRKASKEVKEAAGSIGEDLERINKGFEAFNGVLETLGVGLSLEGIRSFIESNVELARQLQATATAAGVNTTALQELQSAGSSVGVASDAVSGALEKLNRDIGEAARGDKTLVAAFNDLGVSIRDSEGHVKSTEQVFTELIAAYGDVGSASERARLSNQLFGRSWTDIAPMLSMGADSLQEARQAAEDMGSVIRPETLATLRQMGQELDDLGDHARAAGARLATDFAQAVDFVTRTLNTAITNFENIKTQVQETWRLTNLVNARSELKAIDDEIKHIDDNWAVWLGLVSRDSYMNDLLKRRAELLAQIDGLVAAKPGGPPGQRNLISAPVAEGGDITDTTAADAAAKAAEQQAKQVQAVIDGLAYETKQLTADAEQQKINTALRQAGSNATDAQRAAVIAAAEAYNTQKKAVDDLNQSLAEEKKHREEIRQAAARIEEAVLTPQEKVNEEIAKAAELWRENAISLDTYLRYARQLQDGLKTTEDQTKQLDLGVGDLAKSLGSDVVRAFTDAGSSADRFRNLAVHVLEDVVNWIVKLLEQSEKMGGSGGGGGIFDLLGKAFGSLFGGASSDALAGGVQGSLEDAVMIPGLQHGADFAVGGYGPPDSTLVMFRASPGERVRVGNAAGDMGQVLHLTQNLSITTPDADSFRRSQRQIMVEGYAMARAAARRMGHG